LGKSVTETTGRQSQKLIAKTQDEMFGTGYNQEANRKIGYYARQK